MKASMSELRRKLMTDLSGLELGENREEILSTLSNRLPPEGSITIKAYGEYWTVTNKFPSYLFNSNE
jgi:hypothetical protein